MPSSLISAVIVPASIPSPSQGVWHLGPLPIRAYALCILAGIFAGYWLGRRRWVARGGSPTVLADIMFWAIPFGLVGSRIYHVVTDAELYFGPGENPIDALKIWHGGLGIWGAIGFGALGAWIACRRAKVPFLAVADAMAPGLALAQIFGRFGNYFNQELFGRPTNLPWGLEIGFNERPAGFKDFATFHPTFLYEALWNVGVIALIILLGRRFTLGHGRAFFLYVAAYTAGRAWIENMRIDTVNHFLGLRLNVWTSFVLFVLAVVAFAISAVKYPGQEDISTGPAAGQPLDDAEASTDAPDEPAKPEDSTAPVGATATAAGAESTAGAESGATADAEPGTSSEHDEATSAAPERSSEDSAEAEPAGGSAASDTRQPVESSNGSDGARD
ncbi:prolipoprotein diacylglyceryl transferase [Kribbella sp. NPDC050124]|uniref:prolipoprotein diacylglyceryl transferase n=1 Tax=Kribbella sp. NPDC050124 TaxID=3364114 RepID=UPI0037B571A3